LNHEKDSQTFTSLIGDVGVLRIGEGEWRRTRIRAKHSLPHPFLLSLSQSVA